LVGSAITPTAVLLVVIVVLLWAGHWVVLEPTILDVKFLMAVVYAWSQRGLLYFISTGGSTELHDEKYLSSFFKDNFGNFVFKEINCPKCAHILYKNLSLIVESKQTVAKCSQP
jgi:hypothetical protein